MSEKFAEAFSFFFTPEFLQIADEWTGNVIIKHWAKTTHSLKVILEIVLTEAECYGIMCFSEYLSF